MLETWATVELKHDDHLMIMIHDDLPIVSRQTAWNDQLWRKSPLSKSRCYTDISWLTSLDQFGAIKSSNCSTGEAMDV
jgi:hypothetical protein